MCHGLLINPNMPNRHQKRSTNLEIFIDIEYKNLKNEPLKYYISLSLLINKSDTSLFIARIGPY